MLAGSRQLRRKPAVPARGATPPGTPRLRYGAPACSLAAASFAASPQCRPGGRPPGTPRLPYGAPACSLAAASFAASPQCRPGGRPPGTPRLRYGAPACSLAAASFAASPQCRPGGRPPPEPPGSAVGAACRHSAGFGLGCGAQPLVGPDPAVSSGGALPGKTRGALSPHKITADEGCA